MDDKIKIFDARVNVQDIAVSNLQTLVSHSENIYVIQCHFDETWEGYTKKAVFQSKTRTINVIMASDEVQVPHEMIEDIELGFRMGVYGVKGSAIKPTVYTKILVGKLGAYGGDDTQEPTPDQYQQIINLIESGQLKGEGATIEIGTVETVGSGQPAEVTNSGTETHAIFDFKIPQGTPESGDSGQIIVRNPNGNTWETAPFVKPDLTEEYYKNVTDSADFPFTDFQVNGNTYQAQGTGKNLYDFKTIFKTNIEKGTIVEVHPNVFRTIASGILSINNDFSRYFSSDDIGKSFTFSCDITLIRKHYETGVLYNVYLRSFDSALESSNINSTTARLELNKKVHASLSGIVPQNTTTGIGFTYSNSCDIIIENIQLEQSETETEFEPYANLLPAPTPDNPMPIINAGTYNEDASKYEVHMSLSDGTNTQDVTLTSDVELTKWDRLERRDGVWGWSINGVTITNILDYTWSVSDSTDESNRSFYLSMALNGFNTNKQSEGKCSHLEHKRYSQTGYLYNSTQSSRSLFITSDDIEENSVDAFVKWVNVVEESSGKPITITYESSKEIAFNPLPEEEQTLLNSLRTYYPQTTFSVEDYATVTGKYVADAKTYIDNKVSELEALVASAYTMGVNSIE